MKENNLAKAILKVKMYPISLIVIVNILITTFITGMAVIGVGVLNAIVPNIHDVAITTELIRTQVAANPSFILPYLTLGNTIFTFGVFLVILVSMIDWTLKAADLSFGNSENHKINDKQSLIFCMFTSVRLYLFVFLVWLFINSNLGLVLAYILKNI